MFLGGTIEVRTPDLEEKEITFESDVSAEFYLYTKKGTKPMVDSFNISVELNEDKEVTMSTDIEEEGIFHNYFLIGIENKKGDGISLSLSIEQVNTLSQILGRFKEGYYAVKALAAGRVVKSV